VTRNIEIVHVTPNLLSPNPWNSNSVGPEMEQRLRASIEEFGLYKPIIVRELSDGSLQILGGEHRWRVACQMGLALVPIVNVGPLEDRRAKAMGLADNGQYGEDDASKLALILQDIGVEDVQNLLPYSAQDLAGMFAAADVDLANLGFDDNDEVPPLPDAGATRPTVTHELMRFKVPVEDRERVERLIQNVIKTKGFAAEQDSMVAAGMALVEICNAARDHF
jgi:ParB family chromosome partitioning protein